jgi:hypothetical protein
MTYISGSPAANQWNAEDRQASHVPTWQEATILNMADNIIRQIEEMRTFNSDTHMDGYMTDAISMLRGLKDDIEAV